MDGISPVNWFIALAILAALAWTAGVRLGRGPVWAGRCAILLAVLCILGWGWLVRHPATAVQVVPPWMLSRIEGVGGVPWFMMILGVAWTRCYCARQRHVVGWALMFGVIYFINGGMWMLQQTPTAAMAHQITGREVRQSQSYSCVPAACATAMNLLGLPTSEALMAELTQTRPGSGATIVRALDGLTLRASGSDYEPVLLEPRWAQLRTMPMPVLTPLQFEPTRRHMVTLTSIHADGVWLMDPVDGYHFLPLEEFLLVYRGQIIAFDRLSRGG